jgi:hypothetical protein
MKTIITTLPIYDNILKQCYERSRRSGNGIIPIISPRHRLPSFQWLDGADGCGSVSKIETLTEAGTADDITAHFAAMPTLAHDYFTYPGTTLSTILDVGIYYLRITMNNGKVYYSDWFKVDCVYGDSTQLPPTDHVYSTKYLIINFHNHCDLGDILYQDGLTQTIWLESETMENSFPLKEEGAENGQGRFVRTFGRQTKKYLARTMQLPGYMVDVFNRMRLHDTITITDLVGDVYTVYNLEVEHEWLYDDKYYCKLDLTFDYDETVVVSGCCTI